ncbi:uncharacterized protein LOC107043478 [Diachasma alloeum]|uniref:uncharacterized protein LOC107043478 n=1 Tax=Diachasma alloeum TaxID=454923 RepID=UPI00073810F5|nr:uncharacterized protein LOC107043478 [Diachasma alloeum]
MYPVALRSDIEKMFRHIIVASEEQYLQRTLWQPPGTTFASHRRLLSDLYSDSGNTFKGTERELWKFIDELYQNANVQANIATKKIEWHFILPTSPYFGGLWEAGRKSVKNLIKELLDDCMPNFEEWTTLLSKIECNWNSRPLGRLRDDPEDIVVSTAGHFLIGRPLNAVPVSST